MALVSPILLIFVLFYFDKWNFEVEKCSFL